jgi:hypothetical protein
MARSELQDSIKERARPCEVTEGQEFRQSSPIEFRTYTRMSQQGLDLGCKKETLFGLPIIQRLNPETVPCQEESALA